MIKNPNFSVEGELHSEHKTVFPFGSNDIQTSPEGVSDDNGNSAFIIAFGFTALVCTMTGILIGWLIWGRF